MPIQQPKGMRDFPPEEKIFRDELLSTLKRIFEQFGFNPLETPILERYDVLAAKYAGGAEILKETFTLKDQGDRNLGLRYDLTVPLARFIAMNPNVKMPFKRYAIGTVYRDGPIKLGRYREFYQCDVDTVGANSALSDAQFAQIALAVFKDLKIDVTVYINSIELLKEMLTKDGVPEKKLTDTMIILDKLKKIGEKGVKKELADSNLDTSTLQNVLDIASKKTNKEKINTIKKTYGEIAGLERIQEILTLVPDVVFDPSLARGLAYYTGAVFEAFATDSKVKSSLMGGGRYDKMIGGFIGRLDDYPACGISFGLEPIMETLREQEEMRKTVTQVFVIPIKTPKESNELTQELRTAGINADVDLLGRSISKNLDYANTLGIPYVIILGEKEIASGKYNVKNMTTGDEQAVERKNIAKVLQEKLC